MRSFKRALIEACARKKRALEIAFAQKIYENSSEAFFGVFPDTFQYLVLTFT